MLRRALDEARRADRRIALATAAIDAPTVWGDLADRLAGRPGPARADDRSSAWRRLEREAKLCSLQGRKVVLAVDGIEDVDQASRRDLMRLARIDGVTAILVGRDDDPEDVAGPGPWTLAIRLAPLTFSEAREYLAAKLAAAGGPEGVFTHRAAVRLHAASRGVPRGLDRLASLALAAAAARGLEAVASEVVDGVAAECRAPAD